MQVCVAIGDDRKAQGTIIADFAHVPFHWKTADLMTLAPSCSTPRCLRRIVMLSSILLLSAAVWAHPLGDFSINQYFVLDGTGPTLKLSYLLDVAEIPSFTELDLLDTDFDSEITQVEVETYLAQRIPQLEQHLRLEIDGTPVALSLLRHKLILLQGNAGMVVFNIRMDLEARDVDWPPAHGAHLSLQSENYPLEQGTRETLLLCSAPLRDVTAASREAQKRLDLDGVSGVYDNDATPFRFELAPDASSPAPGVSKDYTDFAWTSTVRLAKAQGEAGMADGIAQAMVEPGFQDDYAGGPGKPLLSIAKEVSPEIMHTGIRQGPDTVSNRLMNRVSSIVRSPTLPMPLVFAGLCVALFLGMGHALAPGHGKTVMAAYLIGEKGTSWHAVILGIVVTITHTWSVIALGLVTLYFEDFLSEEQINFWTGIVSGLIIVVIGVVLFRQRYQRFLANAPGQPGDWRFEHGHDHAIAPPPLAVATEDGPPSYRNILWLGISGGVVPCPAALIVLLLALKVGRLSYGLGLLLAFSLGLALVLVIIGILVVRASRLFRNRINTENSILQALPLGSAALITLLGVWVVVWTLLQFELLAFA